MNQAKIIIAWFIFFSAPVFSENNNPDYEVNFFGIEVQDPNEDRQFLVADYLPPRTDMALEGQNVAAFYNIGVDRDHTIFSIVNLSNIPIIYDYDSDRFVLFTKSGMQFYLPKRGVTSLDSDTGFINPGHVTRFVLSMPYPIESEDVAKIVVVLNGTLRIVLKPYQSLLSTVEEKSELKPKKAEALRLQPGSGHSRYKQSIAELVALNWSFAEAEVGWTCDVYFIQDEDGYVEAVNVQDCNTGQGIETSDFKRSLEMAVYKSSPFPLPKDLREFSYEVIFRLEAY